jgi:hypothetical protein
VTFSEAGKALGTATLTNGQATWTTSTLSLGNHTITAAYGGDAENATSSDSRDQTISQAVPILSLTPSSSSPQAGSQVTLTAVVTGAVSGQVPTGSIAFGIDGAALATVPLDANGQAAATIPSIAVGNHTVTASYSGDASDQAVSATASVQVALFASTLYLTASANPVLVGDTLVLTATVVGGSGTVPPSGWVTFDAETGTTTTSPLTNGTATASVSVSYAGTLTFQATYGGDVNFASTSSSITVTVNDSQPPVYDAGAPTPPPWEYDAGSPSWDFDAGSYEPPSYPTYDPQPPPEPRDPMACDCDMVGGRASGSASLLALGVAAAAVLRRRRRGEAIDS